LSSPGGSCEIAQQVQRHLEVLEADETMTDGFLDPDSFSKAFKRFARQVGIPNARLHDIRHAAATTMMERGVHPAVVTKTLGHASEAFTMSVYGHVRDEMLDQAATALGDRTWTFLCVRSRDFWDR
jgi:integrase